MRSTVASRRRRDRSNLAYVAMLARMIRSAGDRVGEGEPWELAHLRDLHRAIDDAMAVAVAGLRGAGYTWQEIGDALGTTRQAAIMRWVQRL